MGWIANSSTPTPTPISTCFSLWPPIAICRCLRCPCFLLLIWLGSSIAFALWCSCLLWCSRLVHDDDVEGTDEIFYAVACGDIWGSHLVGILAKSMSIQDRDFTCSADSDVCCMLHEISAVADDGRCIIHRRKSRNRYGQWQCFAPSTHSSSSTSKIKREIIDAHHGRQNHRPLWRRRQVLSRPSPHRLPRRDGHWPNSRLHCQFLQTQWHQQQGQHRQIERWRRQTNRSQGATQSPSRRRLPRQLSTTYLHAA